MRLSHCSKVSSLKQYHAGPLLRNRSLGANIKRGPGCSKGYTIFKNPQRTAYVIPATIDTMAETASFTIECHETVQKWKYFK